MAVTLEKKKEIKSRFYADFEEMRTKSNTKRALTKNDLDLGFCKEILAGFEDRNLKFQ